MARRSSACGLSGSIRSARSYHCSAADRSPSSCHERPIHRVQRARIRQLRLQRQRALQRRHCRGVAPRLNQGKTEPAERLAGSDVISSL